MPSPHHTLPRKRAKSTRFTMPTMSTIVNSAFDSHAVIATIQHLAGRNLRTLPARDLNTAAADLTRAGVRVDALRAMQGKTLLAAVYAEQARRAAREADSPTAPARPVVLGAYSAAFAAVVDGPEPVKYSQYW